MYFPTNDFKDPTSVKIMN